MDEFWAAAKPDADIFGYAVEELNQIQPLPDREIEIKKLKPGMYADNELQLRLVVAEDGKRQWIFYFFWREEVRNGRLVKGEFRRKMLGDSTTSLEKARELAIKARRVLASGQNPITGEWLNEDLKRAHSKS